MLSYKFSSRVIRICRYAITRLNSQNAGKVLKIENTAQTVTPIVDYPPNTPDNFTNVYVKNFDDKLDDEKLHKLFEKYGTILSCIVMKTEEGKSRGFGFVSFENTYEAKRAVNEMNGSQVPDSNLKLTACRALPKEERKAELDRIYEDYKSKQERRYKDVKLYIENLDASINNEKLRRHFEKYGEITSSKIIRRLNKFSKRYGFVCFEKPEDAMKAAIEMNNHTLNGNRLYVTFLQGVGNREVNLDSNYTELMAVMRMKFDPQQQNSPIRERLHSIIRDIAKPDQVDKLMEMLIVDSELSNLMENQDLLQNRVNEMLAGLDQSKLVNV